MTIDLKPEHWRLLGEILPIAAKLLPSPFGEAAALVGKGVDEYCEANAIEIEQSAERGKAAGEAAAGSLSLLEKCKGCHYGNPISGVCRGLDTRRASYCRVNGHTHYAVRVG